MIDYQYEWNKGRDWFTSEKSIPDVIFYGVDFAKWKTLLSSFVNNQFVQDVNIYNPITDENISSFPSTLNDLIEEKDFNCHIRLVKNGISLMIHFFEEKTIDCDIYTDEITTAEDYENLISHLFEIQRVSQSDKFTMNPEGDYDFIYNINGKFMKSEAEYLELNLSK